MNVTQSSAGNRPHRGHRHNHCHRRMCTGSTPTVVPTVSSLRPPRRSTRSTAALRATPEVRTPGPVEHGRQHRARVHRERARHRRRNADPHCRRETRPGRLSSPLRYTCMKYWPAGSRSSRSTITYGPRRFISPSSSNMASSEGSSKDVPNAVVARSTGIHTSATLPGNAAQAPPP